MGHKPQGKADGHLHGYASAGGFGAEGPAPRPQVGCSGNGRILSRSSGARPRGFGLPWGFFRGLGTPASGVRSGDGAAESGGSGGGPPLAPGRGRGTGGSPRNAPLARGRRAPAPETGTWRQAGPVRPREGPGLAQERGASLTLFLAGRVQWRLCCVVGVPGGPGPRSDVGVMGGAEAGAAPARGPSQGVVGLLSQGLSPGPCAGCPSEGPAEPRPCGVLAPLVGWHPISAGTPHRLAPLVGS